jgi:hypothetical protein
LQYMLRGHPPCGLSTEARRPAPTCSHAGRFSPKAPNVSRLSTAKPKSVQHLSNLQCIHKTLKRNKVMSHILRPGKDPRDGPQLAHAAVLLPARRPAPDVEVSELALGGGLLEVGQEIRVLVNQVAVVLAAGLRDLLHYLTPALGKQKKRLRERS